MLRTIMFGIALAAAPATAFAQKAQVTCNDGTTAKAGRGACSHHGGIMHKTAAARPATKAEARRAAESVKSETQSIEKTVEKKGREPARLPAK
jgi:hypothetical protein